MSEIRKKIEIGTKEVGDCFVCAGKIIEDIQEIYIPPQGFGYRVGAPRRTNYRITLYCQKCGIQYHHIPEKKT